MTATAGDPVTQDDAWLFLGVEEQLLGRLDLAGESFDKAAGLYPRAQSPYLALSQLARRSGDRLGAHRAIQQVLALSADDREREDPWWTVPRRERCERADAAVRDSCAVLTPQER